MNQQTTGSSGLQTVPQNQARPVFSYLRHLLFVGMLSLAGNAAAAITVDLSITNETDAFGNFTLIKGDKVKVDWVITEDTDDDLHHKDKIQVVRVSNDEVVVSALRERKGKTNGSISLKLNQTGELMYVRYIRKGNAATEIARFAHPDDDDPSLQAINPVSGEEVTREIHNLKSGAVSISPRGFVNENASAHQLDLCIWHVGTQNYGYFISTIGSEVADCDPVAPVSLPHGRTITEIHCSLVDNAVSNEIDFRLYAVNLETGNASLIGQTPDSVDSGLVQTVSDTTMNANFALVDNKTYAYSIFVSYQDNDFTSLGTNGRIFGCSIYYE